MLYAAFLSAKYPDGLHFLDGFVSSKIYISPPAQTSHRLTQYAMIEP
jgi:hypothetical protein